MLFCFDFCYFFLQPGKVNLNVSGALADVVNMIRFSPDGSYFAAGSRDRTTRIWQAGTKNFCVSLPGHGSNICCVVLLLSRNLFIRCNIVLPYANCNCCAKGGITALAYSRDGVMLATGSYNNIVKVWKVTTGEIIQTLKGHSGFFSMLFRPCPLFYWYR